MVDGQVWKEETLSYDCYGLLTLAKLKIFCVDRILLKSVIRLIFLSRFFIAKVTALIKLLFERK